MQTATAPAKWGFSMAGCEWTILAAVQSALEDVQDSPFRYLEIGVAQGDTFARVCESIARAGRSWEAIALDLPEGIEAAEGYQRVASCFDASAFAANAAPFGGAARLVRAVSWDWIPGRATIWPLGLVLIDGCHERECVARDFLAVEPLMAEGGVVIFHDTALWSQKDPEQIQPHRGEHLEVLAAIQDLRFLDASRPGWRFVAEAPGLQEQGGRGCMAFQRRSA